MPFAVTHVLVTIILLDIFRDFIFKDKKKIPLFYIFLGGFAGLLPDIDLPIQWLLSSLGLAIEGLHRTFTHAIFMPLLLLVISYLVRNRSQKGSMLLAIFSFGFTIHILLDFLLLGFIMPLYPFSTAEIGLNLMARYSFEGLAGLDALLLLGWLYYLSKTKKIRDFI